MRRVGRRVTLPGSSCGTPRPPSTWMQPGPALLGLASLPHAPGRTGSSLLLPLLRPPWRMIEPREPACGMLHTGSSILQAHVSITMSSSFSSLFLSFHRQIYKSCTPPTREDRGTLVMARVTTLHLDPIYSGALFKNTNKVGCSALVLHGCCTYPKISSFHAADVRGTSVSIVGCTKYPLLRVPFAVLVGFDAPPARSVHPPSFTAVLIALRTRAA